MRFFLSSLEQNYRELNYLTLVSGTKTISQGRISEISICYAVET